MRQTVFCLPIDPRDKGHKDPAEIDLNVPRCAQYLHSAWKKHPDAVYWVDINLAIEKGSTFDQISIECNHPSRNTSSLLYSKSCQIENRRSLVWDRIHVTSTSAKDLLTSRLDKRIGFKSRSTTARSNCEQKLLNSHEEKFLDKQILPTKKFFQNQPNQSKTNLWSIRATWCHA